MIKRVAVLVFVAALAIPSFSFGQIAPSGLTVAEDQFALDLCRQVAGAPGNFIFSPSSVDMALGMVFAGAKGNTAAEMARALHINVLAAPPGLLAVYLQDMAKYDVAGPNNDPNVTLISANALWGARGYQFRADYLKTIAVVFGGALTPVDFSEPLQAADTINGWVAAHTAGKIQDLISPENLRPGTRLVLTNAVYFKGNWSTKFDAGQTAPAPFHLAAGRAVMVPMMNMTDELDYGEADGAQILTLYYGYSGDSMTILLPKPHVGLDAVERGMTAGLLAALPRDVGPAKVAVKLPKFTVKSGFDLNDMLRRLGIHDMFSRTAADLSGIAADPAARRLFISDVVHKAYVAVDETGTVAAAATGGVAAVALSAPDFNPPVPFVADHPFLFLIRDAAEQILFIGRVDNPAAGG